MTKCRPMGTPRSLRLVPLLVLLAAATPVFAQRTRVNVTVDRSSTSTRLILTHSEQIGYVIQEGNGRLEVIYSQPVVIDPAGQRFDDDVLKRYDQRRGNRLVLRTGDSFRGYESFELHNPFRLVLDLQNASMDSVLTTPSFDPDPRRKIIVIDPGHGGVETGAIGPTGLREKEVVLDLARRLQRRLQRDHNLTVVLTRDEDRLIGLDERTAIANYNRADLFLSIHLNASPRSTATGAETYFLSNDATDDAARTLAALENGAAGVRLDPVDKAPDHNLDLVLWDLAQNQYLAESSLLAERVQWHLNALTGTRNRGVRQAPFRVLMGATMPAVLVEAGFVSNIEEEERFRSMEYRSRVAEAIETAVREFLHELDRLQLLDPRAGRP
ncbi:MAG: N-acetylmuramoyl-L-alanine amidase [Acidobacteria bacterium]|nr:MAG: N-acetylmuramoyl-L-alanine amidase [Acidobacteriota bacterium]